MIALLASCNQDNTQGCKDGQCRSDGFKKRRIDGCQYLEFENGDKASMAYTYSITHCGNCDNPIHKTQNPLYVDFKH